MRPFFWIATLCYCALFCTGCLSTLFKGEETNLADSKAEYVAPGEPRIVPGLTLRVSVTASGAEAVQESMKEVNLNGEILMPLIGAVKCQGKTLLEVQEAVQTAYKKYYLDPQVSISFAFLENPRLKSPWGTVLVMGEVAAQGPVNMPATLDLTVTRALMLAGNATPMADKSRVRVTRRKSDGSLKRFIVDIEKIGKEGRSDLDIVLKPGDVVWVPESWY